MNKELKAQIEEAANKYSASMPHYSEDEAYVGFLDGAQFIIDGALKEANKRVEELNDLVESFSNGCNKRQEQIEDLTHQLQSAREIISTLIELEGMPDHAQGDEEYLDGLQKLDRWLVANTQKNLTGESGQCLCKKCGWTWPLKSAPGLCCKCNQPFAQWGE
jgi:hypothetical protein